MLMICLRCRAWGFWGEGFGLFCSRACADHFYGR